VIAAYRNVIMIVVALLLAAELTWAATLAAAAQPPRERAPISIAVIGDQNTAGFNNREVWPTLLAARTGWSVSNYALHEAGFAADGTGGQAYVYQVERAQAAHPRIILFATGTADAALNESEAIMIGAMDALTKAIRGGQQVAVVGPIWYATPIPDSIQRLNDAVQKVAEVAGAPFLNGIDPPMLSKKLMHPDLSAPNDAGQSVIADRIAAWLQSQVLR